MDTIGIKIKTKNQIPCCIKILRKFTELSVIEIKDKINNNDFVYECDYVDGDGIQKVISLYQELTAAQVETELFEHERLTNIDFLTNLSNTYNEIDSDVDKLFDEKISNR